MALTNRTLAGGGSNPDVVVQVENNGTEDIPTYKPRRRGFDEYDSGNFAVTNGAPGVVTALTIYPEGGTIINPTDEPRVVTWTNTAGDVLGMKIVGARDTIQMPLPLSGSFVGLKMGADGAGVRAQVAGAK